jgi:hypothetical protein
MVDKYFVSNIILIFHFIICFFGTRKNKWQQIPYFTDFIENFEFSLVRPFTIFILTIIYSNMLFDKNVDDNFKYFSLSWANTYVILNIITCILVTGVLVHTLSEDALSRKLHKIYAFVGVLCGNSSVLIEVSTTKDYDFSLYSLLVFGIFNIVATILLVRQYAFYNNVILEKYVLPISEHLYITSSIPIYFEKYFDKFSMFQTYLQLFFVFFFIYFISNTEIRKNPKYNTELEVNYYSLLYYRRKRERRRWYHSLLIPVDLFCILFNLYKIDGVVLESRFFENIHGDKQQQFCGVGGFEITIYEPRMCL